MDKKIVIFDLDGTLAIIDKRRDLARKPNGKFDWDVFHDASNISFVCCPRAGAMNRMAPGVTESFTGIPMFFIRPIFGDSVSTSISLACA